MLKHMRGETSSVVTFEVRIGGLIPFGPIWIVLWVHGNLGLVDLRKDSESKNANSYITNCKY